MDKKNKIIIITIIVISVVLLGLALFFINIPKEKTITYNIIFDSNGGTEVQNQIINHGELVQKPQDPIKEGYMFVEWTYQDLTYDFSLEVTKELTLVAKWIEVKNDVETFVVKFETDGGTTISNQIIEKGNKIVRPIDPIKEGYVFKGWFLNDEIYDFESVVESDIELRANWEKVVTVNNNTTNNSTNNNKPTNNGSNNNSGTNTTTPSTPAVTKYTVTFNSNGGSSVASQTVEEGSKATQPQNPTRSGHTFAGWTLNGSAYDFNKSVTGNITLIAKWTENPKVKYTVTFNSNGGSTVSSQTITEGNKAIQPSNPEKEGYNFAGWLLNGSAYDFNKLVTGHITLTAKWNQKNYTITATPKDSFSVDMILSVYQDGEKINVSAIKYTDGVLLCSGSNTVVSWSDIAEESTLLIVLQNGTTVRATIV